MMSLTKKSPLTTQELKIFKHLLRKIDKDCSGYWITPVGDIEFDWRDKEHHIDLICKKTLNQIIRDLDESSKQDLAMYLQILHSNCRLIKSQNINFSQEKVPPRTAERKSEIRSHANSKSYKSRYQKVSKFFKKIVFFEFACDRLTNKELDRPNMHNI